MTPEIIQLCRDAALAAGLAPELVCAVVETESAGNPWLSRYEPGFFTRYLDKSAIHIVVQEFCRKAPFTVSFETELRDRAFSRGLCQVMGQVARERGFTGPLAQLHDPQMGLAIGCQHLKWCGERVGLDTRKTLLKYNGGGDATYPDRVLAKVGNYD